MEEGKYRQYPCNIGHLEYAQKLPVVQLGSQFPLQFDGEHSSR